MVGIGFRGGVEVGIGIGFGMGSRTDIGVGTGIGIFPHLPTPSPHTSPHTSPTSHAFPAHSSSNPTHSLRTHHSLPKHPNSYPTYTPLTPQTLSARSLLTPYSLPTLCTRFVQVELQNSRHQLTYLDALGGAVSLAVELVARVVTTYAGWQAG